MKDFNKKIRKILEANGWHPPADPNELVEIWEEFVSECENGYYWTIYEFDNEIRVREKLELILKSPELQNHAELDHLSKQVEHIDSRLKKLFISGFSRPNKRNWWEEGVLTYAGEDYVNDLNREYGLNVRIV